MKHCLLWLSLVLSLLSQSLAAQGWEITQFPPRLLTQLDERWLQRQVGETDQTSLIVFEREYESWLGIENTNGLEVFQPNIERAADVVFVAPRKIATFLKLEQGISVEQSGQSITLPDYSFPSLNELSNEQQLQYWLSQDLTPLRFLIQSAQQEIGWSDFEVAQLLRRYASTLLSNKTQTPFLAVYWHQAGYQVQLTLDQEQASLFYRIDGSAVAWPMVRHRSRHWLTFDREFNGEVRFPQALEIKGQALRLSSMNDRSSTTQFSSVMYRFDWEDQTQFAQFELPSYWVKIIRSPHPHEMQFTSKVPRYLLDQISSMIQGELDVERLRSLALWLRQNFEETNKNISVQQSLILKKQNNETRVILLASFWSFLTSKPVALVVENDQNYLALQLGDTAIVENAIQYRGHRWWLWHPDLSTNKSLSDLSSSKWTFMP
jgi:hypothetical protein